MIWLVDALLRTPGPVNGGRNGIRGAKERQQVLVPPELFASGVATRRCAERWSGPATPATGHVRHVATVQVSGRVAPDISERPVEPTAGDNTVVFVAGFADLANPVEEHRIRILRLV
jgi:hypothetical protein